MYHIMDFHLLPKQYWILNWETNFKARIIFFQNELFLTVLLVHTVLIVYHSCCSSTCLEFWCSEFCWFRNLEIRCMIKSQLILEMWFWDYIAPNINPRFEISFFRFDAPRSVLCCIQYESYSMINFVSDTGPDMSFDVKLVESNAIEIGIYDSISPS